MSTLYSARQNEYVALVDRMIADRMPREDLLQGVVCRAMSYACDGSGKRLRPILLLSFCELCGGDAEAALPFAAAIEMIHSYSLVHDDLPCMDNSLLRRGKPSTFAAFGEDMALLCGDALLTRAFEVMLDPGKITVPPDQAMRAAYILADAAGIMGMVGGQTIDLQSEGKKLTLSELKTLQEGKTVALISAACRMGVTLGGGTEKQLNAAKAYGEHIGRGFQIVDDILDVTGDKDKLGKPVGEDLTNEKVTYVSLLGLEESKRLAAAHTAAAKEALAAFEDAGELLALTDQLLDRDV